MKIGTRTIDAGQVRDISPLVLDARGRMRLLPSEFWAGTTPDERAAFGHRHGIYLFPTVELVAHLREIIDGRRAIEIGAGNGVMAFALGIPATDSRMQATKKIGHIYNATGQPSVSYGRNIIPRSAFESVRRYEPDVVIGAWITHKYTPARHWAGGNEWGVDEADVIEHCDQYLHLGNDEVHSNKDIWRLPHTKTRHDFIYSRAANGTEDFLASWART